MTLVVGVFLASLLGSVHCVAMCGAFVCGYAGLSGGSTPARAHAAYHLGRLASYAALGAIAGAIGAGVNDMGSLAGLSRVAAVLSAILMIAWASAAIAAALGARVRASAFDGGARALGSVLLRFRNSSQTLRAGATGLLTTLLPCGWLYVFVAVAAGTGGVAPGVLVMSIFWLGTTPALLAIAIGAQRLSGSLRQRLPVASAIVVLVLALLTISGRLQPIHFHPDVGAPITNNVRH